MSRFAYKLIIVFLMVWVIILNYSLSLKKIIIQNYEQQIQSCEKNKYMYKRMLGIKIQEVIGH